jgi:hypothetical protein
MMSESGYQSPFTGAAGQMDAAALEGAAGDSEHFHQISIPTSHCATVANLLSTYVRQTTEAADFGGGPISAGLTAAHKEPAQKINATLNSEMQQWNIDGTRLTTVQNSYNTFVEPGNQANAAIKQFSGVQEQMGITPAMRNGNVEDPTFKLSDKQKEAVKGALDQDKKRAFAERLAQLDRVVNAQGTSVKASRIKLTAAIKQLQAAGLAQFAKETQEGTEKDKEEQEKINKKIEVAKQLGEAFESSLSLGSTMAKGMENFEKAPEAMETAGKGAGVIGGVAAGVMTMVYKNELAEINRRMNVAQQKINAARDAGIELQLDAQRDAVEGAKTECEAEIDKLEQALLARKNHYAEMGKEADEKASGGKDDRLSKLMLYVAQAREASTILDGGIASGQNAFGEIIAARNGMLAHRATKLQYLKRDGASATPVDITLRIELPDTVLVTQMGAKLQSWLGEAKQQKEAMKQVESQLADATR